MHALDVDIASREKNGRQPPKYIASERGLQRVSYKTNLQTLLAGVVFWKDSIRSPLRFPRRSSTEAASWLTASRKSKHICSRALEDEESSPAILAIFDVVPFRQIDNYWHFCQLQ
jgi:hypothetical protein